MRHKKEWKAVVVPFDNGQKIEEVVSKSQEDGWFVEDIRFEQSRDRYIIIAFRILNIQQKTALNTLNQ